MCGIVGIVASESAPPPEESGLRQMLGMIRHRGPDQFGVYLDERAGLGSARLSIVDLAGGQQPIGSQDGRYWIVFNGEIFNHAALRSDLEARGHRFRTRTDTEVVVHAYEEFGPACLEKFNGQFAIAIWDRKGQELFLARDRLGVRPLFHTRVGGSMLFGSEIKSILADRRVSARLDPVALAQVFTYWSPLSPRTAFLGIQEVPPGHYLLAHRGEIRLHRYWNPTFPGPQDAADHRSVEDCVEEFRFLLTDAVRIRLRADVPVGAYLSGGLDSAAIAAVVKRLGVSGLDTFSIAFNDPQFDESCFQQQMARFLVTQLQVVQTAHGDIGRVFPEVIWHAELPLMRTSPAPMYLLAKAVRARNYKVVLTGEGADEFLGGYDIFKEAGIRRFWARRSDSKWRWRLLSKIYPDIAGINGAGESYLQAFFGAGLEDVRNPYFSHGLRWRNNGRTHRFFSAAVQEAAALVGADGPGMPVLPAAFMNWHPLARAQYLEIDVFLSQYLLCSQGDRPAMAHSIEGRFPFLDERLVAFCNRLPPRLKLNGLNEKFLLRRAVRQWLPPEIGQRGKRPYRAPIHRSFFPPEALGYVDEMLGADALRAAGLFNPEAVGKLTAKVRQGGALGETDDMALAGILSTQLLHQLFIKDFQRAKPLADEDDVKVVTHRRQPDSKEPGIFHPNAFSQK